MSVGVGKKPDVSSDMGVRYGTLHHVALLLQSHSTMQNKPNPPTCVHVTTVACCVRLISVWIGWTSSLPGCVERFAGACANADIMLAVKVPVRIFVTKQLPKTPTSKIQRRMMEHFRRRLARGVRDQARRLPRPTAPNSRRLMHKCFTKGSKGCCIVFFGSILLLRRRQNGKKTWHLRSMHT